MPTIQPVYSDATAVEPVSVEQAARYIRLDWPVGVAEADLTEEAKAEREDLLLYLSAARGLCEGETGQVFAGGQTVDYTYSLDEVYSLPTDVNVVKVSGFFTSLEALQNWSLEEYRKGISINREYELGWATKQSYTVRVELPASVSASCPPAVKMAILELTAELYRNRETSSPSGVGQSRELPVSYRVKLAPFKVKQALF